MRQQKTKITDDLKEIFNDICMREMGLDIDEYGRVFDLNTNSLYQYKDKYLKYCDKEDPIVRPNEIELNLLENSRLLLVLFGLYLDKYCKQNNIYVNSYYQSTSIKGNLGYMACSFNNGGVLSELKSDLFINESARILNLICRLNGSCNLYDFQMFNVL